MRDRVGAIACVWGVLWMACALLSGVLGVAAAPREPAATTETPGHAMGGPFRIRSLSPVQLLFFQFTPERALPVPHDAWDLHVDVLKANILARDRRGDDFFLFDFELTRANLALEYGIYDRLAIGLEIPLLYTWRGVLDDPIKQFESVTGFKRTIRFNRSQHLFSYLLQKDGRTVLQGQPGALGIGDIALTSKALLWKERAWTPAIAARFALKLPTGDEDRALGSGEVDVGLGLALEKTLGPVRLYFNGSLTLPTGDPFAGTGIESVPMLSGFLTAQYHLTRYFSLMLQLNGVSPPVRQTGLDIGKASFEILAGVAWEIPSSSLVWQAGFMEDINNTDRTADVAVFMSWSVRFSRPSSPSACCQEPAQ